MRVKLPLSVLCALCILLLFGMVATVPAADDGLIFDPLDGAYFSTASASGMNYQRVGEDLERYIPAGMERLEEFDVTINPNETFEIVPLLYDEPLEVDRDTPIGALDAAAEAGDLQYLTAYNESLDYLLIVSIDDYEFQAEPFASWFVLHEIQRGARVERDVNNHTLSDGETIWFVYLEPGDAETFDEVMETAEVGFPVTVHFGGETPTVTTPVPTTPVPTTPVPTTPVPTTPVPTTPVPTTPVPTTPVPTTPTPTPTPLGQDLYKDLPFTMNNFGAFNVTISPGKPLEIQPVNLNETIKVDNNTPLGALDAASKVGGFNYSPWYHVSDEYLQVDSIKGINITKEWEWFTFYEDAQGSQWISKDITDPDHMLSDRETIWFIYINRDLNDTFAHNLATAKYGLSITTTFAPNTSVVNVIENNANLTTLALLIREANLTETLSTGGPYTVFAPDNMAFADLGIDTIAGLAKNTSDLARILTYHVVPGEYSAEELLNMTAGGNETTLKNLAGENLTLNQTENRSLTVNGVLVVNPDLGADNGIVHVIDAVLTPSATNETPTPTATANATPAANKT
jgi:uncharacterized surface protein with fasciclin (FAS1) repeats/cell division septation protein DedD